MRSNALLKLLMGGSAGLVLTVSGTQCGSIVNENSPINSDNPYAGFFQANGSDSEMLLGDPGDAWLDWEYLE